MTASMPNPRAGLRRRLLRRLLSSSRSRRRLVGMANAVWRADLLSRSSYQPVDELGIDVAPATRERIEGRWRAMEAVLDEVGAKSALDIGAAEGFYALRIAERGIPVLAIELKQRPFDLLSLVVAERGLTNLAQTRMLVSPASAGLLPSADAVVLLAVWHHWVRYFGLDAANEVLAQVWGRTSRVLFFETGENMSDDYGLPPLGPDPRASLERFLADVCAGSEVRFLGRFPDRHLFAVIRRSPAKDQLAGDESV